MKGLKSIAFVVVLLMTFLLPIEVFAHSALVSTTPDPVSETEVTELTLTFNEPVEPASSVKVTNEANEEQAVKDTAVEGKMMTVALEQPLKNGVYTVDWKIISKDGHPAKGSYTFEVKVAAISPSPTQVPSAPTVGGDKPSPSLAPPTKTTVPPIDLNQADQEDTESEDSSDFDLSKWLLVGAAGLLIVAVAVSLLKKKKKKN